MRTRTDAMLKSTRMKEGVPPCREKTLERKIQMKIKYYLHLASEAWHSLLGRSNVQIEGTNETKI